MSGQHAQTSIRSRQIAGARRAAIIAAMRHVTPVGIDDSQEQFDDFDDDELWELADEAEDDELYRAAHSEIVRRQMNRKKRRKTMRGPVRKIGLLLLILLVIGGPLLAMWLLG